jgi:hypothetical protein
VKARYESLASVLATEATPRVSVLMPIHVSRPDENRIRLEGLLKRAESDLASGGIPKSKTGGIISDLADAGTPLLKSGGGLAIFAAPGYVDAFSTLGPLDEAVFVGERFHVAPIVGSVASDHCFLVAVSRGTVRMWRCTGSRAEAVPLEGAPGSLEAFSGFVDREKQLQARQTERGGGAPIFHGHGIGEGRDVETLKQFLRAVDAAAMGIVRVDPGPVLFAGPPGVPALYGEVTQLGSHLVETITTQPEELDAEEVAVMGRRLLEASADSEVGHALSEIRSRLGTGTASEQAAVVATAALEGRVDTLVFSPLARVWGSITSETGRVALEGDVELVNLAVVETIVHGGDALSYGALEADAAALFRY